MNKVFFILIISVLSITACKKDKSDKLQITTFSVVNAAVDMPAIKVNVGGVAMNYASAPQIAYGTAAMYYAPRASTLVKILSTADTVNPLVNSSIDFKSGVYSVYLVGQLPTIETIIKEETNFPFIRQDITPPSSDSVVNVRFVNLSPNSVPVKIKVASAATNEIDNLPYKGISDFKIYTAKLTTTTYSFQIRDAATDALITTYTFTTNATNRFKSVALVIKGLQGTATGTNAFGVFAVNYF